MKPCGSVVAAAVTGLFVLGATASGAGSQTPRQPLTWGNFGSWTGYSSSNIATPTPVSGVPGTITQIATNNSDVYALTSAGQVWSWGADESGQLGNGTVQPTGTTLTPVQVEFPSDVIIASLATVGPRDTELALDRAGDAWGWGANGDGQLCTDNTTEYAVPVELPFSHVTLLAGAGEHASYYADGTLYSCGTGRYGALGTGSTASTLRPEAAVGLPDEAVTAMTASWEDEGVVLANGSFWNWGFNKHGELGDQSVTNSDVPVEVALPASVTQASEGGDTSKDGQSVVRLSTGVFYGWGSNQWGQLCTGGTKSAQLHPKKLKAPIAVTWASAVTGGSASYFLDSTGHLWACGNNAQGQLGTGGVGGMQTLPVEVDASGLTQVSSTENTVAAR
jgi:alpha-tubulin suppressor-like RCC1 family protein